VNPTVIETVNAFVSIKAMMASGTYVAKEVQDVILASMRTVQLSLDSGTSYSYTEAFKSHNSGYSIQYFPL
jgi:hypothetical protein